MQNIKNIEAYLSKLNLEQFEEELDTQQEQLYNNPIIYL
jgi:hypothetical protein